MKAIRTALGVFLLAGAVVGQTRPFDVELSYGGWTLSPFRTVVERECERVIRDQLDRLISSAIPDLLVSPYLSDIDLPSSGRFFSLAIWYRFGESRFSAGLRGDYFNFKLPYSVAVSESFEFLGFPLARLDVQGRGSVRLDGLALSLLGRWTPLRTRRLDLSLQAGLMMLPFQGELSMEQTTTLITPIGDLRLSGKIGHDFDEIRALGLDLPSYIYSPTLGIELRWRIAPEVGLHFNATAAQGTFYAGGLFFSF